MKHLLIALAAILVAAQVHAAEYLVKYRNDAAVRTLSFSTNAAIQALDYNAAAHLVKISIPDNNRMMNLIQLIADPNIEYVVPNIRLHAMNVPVEAQALQTQWAIEKVQAQKAWQDAGNKGSKNVVVAVIDTGIDYKHKNLSPNMVAGYDFRDNDSDPMDETSTQNPGHGTHCAGIIGATGVVDGGTTGISPDVSLMPLRFLGSDGSGDLNNAIKAIDYAIEHKVNVISASWGAAVPRSTAQPLIDAIGRAEKAGIVFVVAASNDGQNNDSYEVYPANAGLSNTISVAASNSSDAKPSWSNYGRAKVQLASPGDGIMSTLPGDKYGNLSGTSMATPLVAGLVALVKAQDASLTPMQIRSILQSTGDKVSIETQCDCRINAASAIDAIKAHKLTVSPYAATYQKGDKVQFEAIYGKAPYQFTSSTPSVATIDANGQFVAVANGTTTITVKDATGATATSYNINVADQPPPDDGGGGMPGLPGDGKCPIDNPELCQAACQFMPDLPWCKKN
jgi:thermitase